MSGGWISKELAAKLGITNSKVEDLGWTTLGTLNVESGRVWVGDASFAPSEQDGEIVDLPPGEYEGRVRWVSIDGQELEANLVFAPPGLETTRGSEIGETWADTASQGVCDFELFRAAVKDPDAYWEAYELAVAIKGSTCFTYEGAVLLVSGTGDGDGTFKLFEHLHEGQRAGLEVQFIDPDDGFKVLD